MILLEKITLYSIFILVVLHSFSNPYYYDKLEKSIATLQKSVDALQPKPEAVKLPEKTTPNPIAISSRCQSELQWVEKARDAYMQDCDKPNDSSECKMAGIALNSAVTAFLFCLNPGL